MAANWTGWGLDNNSICPAGQVSASSEYQCESTYPQALNPNNQSWTGVICSPDGNVLCLSLSTWGLSGDGSAMVELAALTEIQMIDLSNNRFTGMFAHKGLALYSEPLNGPQLTHEWCMLLTKLSFVARAILATLHLQQCMTSELTPSHQQVHNPRQYP